MGMEMHKFKSVVTWTYDEDARLFTFSLLDRGGPVITAESYNEGKLKMDTAIGLAISARNLRYFDSVARAKKWVKRNNTGSTKRDVEYIELAR